MKNWKSFLVLIALLGFINCGSQKKKAALFPFLSVFSEESSSEKVISSQSPNRLQTSEDTIYIVKNHSDYQYSIQPEKTGNSPVLFLQAENSQFHFQTVSTIRLQMQLQDSASLPLEGAIVQIHYINSDNEKLLLFSAVTDQLGMLSGSFQVENTWLQIELSIPNSELDSVPVPLFVSSPSQTGESLIVKELQKLQIPGTWQKQDLVDSDKDGMPDAWDAFPKDPSRSTKTRFPVKGSQTVAFEDLFPSNGDADFNDYVFQYYLERELNSKGEISFLSGVFTHTAKGAGFRHSLNVKLHNESQLCNQLQVSESCLDIFSSPIFFESTILDSEGTNLNLGKKRKKLNYSELVDGVELLGDSSKTIQSTNTEVDKPYKPGYTSVVQFEFSKPIPLHLLGEAPYDLFLKILSKKVDSRYPVDAPRATSRARNHYEIHFPGKYFDKAGKDIYLDGTGIPWAISIPGEWEWPLEGKDFSLRNLNSPYPRFQNWAKSGGLAYKDWYKYPNKSMVFPVGQTASNLLAFLKEVDSIGLGILVTIILGSVCIIIVRRKFIQE